MKRLLIFLLVSLSLTSYAQIRKKGKKFRVSTITTPPAIPVNPPVTPPTTPTVVTGQRIYGVIPHDKSMMWQLNAPPAPIDSLFLKPIPTSGNLVQALFNYGQMYQIYDNIIEYQTGMNPEINQIEYGYPYGGFDGRELQIYSTDRTTGVETLMWQTPTGVAKNVKIVTTLPQTYYPKRLRVRVNNNGIPAYLHFKGSYSTVNFPNYAPQEKFPFGFQTGTNAFTWNLMRDEARQRPFTSAMNILEGIGNVRYYYDATDISKGPGDYRFTTNWKGYNSDSLLIEAKKRKVWVQLCLKELTDDIKRTYGADSLANNERLPMNAKGLDPHDVASYTRYGRIVFQVVARYGSKIVPASLLLTADKVTGLNVIDVLEIYNEADKWWKEGPILGPSYADPKTMVAMMSMFYDGHMGQYPNMGAKNADANMPVGPPGLASFHPDFFRQCREEVIALRGYKPDGITPNWPWDHYNAHAYANTKGEQGQSGSTGKIVETSAFAKFFKDFRDSNIPYLGNMRVNLGETGYDVGQHTNYSAIPPTGSGLTPRQWAGGLNLRVALFNAKNGIWHTLHYQYADQAPGNEYAGFLTMGKAYEAFVNGVKTAFPYNTASNFIFFNSFMKPHIHAEELNNYPLVDRWAINGQPDVYTVYSPTDQNVMGTYTLTLPNGTQKATLYSISGDLTVTTPLTITGNTVQVPYSEIPSAVKLNNLNLILSLLLLFSGLRGVAQTKPAPYVPVRMYSLGNIDAVLVNQLARVIGTSHKCPYCVKRKQTSKVYLGVMTTDTLRAQAYFNEAGKLVSPDVNSVKTYLRCSRGDSWSEERKAGKKVVVQLSQLAP